MRSWLIREKIEWRLKYISIYIFKHRITRGKLHKDNRLHKTVILHPPLYTWKLSKCREQLKIYKDWLKQHKSLHRCFLNLTQCQTTTKTIYIPPYLKIIPVVFQCCHYITGSGYQKITKFLYYSYLF